MDSIVQIRMVSKRQVVEMMYLFDVSNELYYWHVQLDCKSMLFLVFVEEDSIDENDVVLLRNIFPLLSSSKYPT